MTLYRIEERVPFSTSLLWRLQERYFSSRGVEAWRSNIVPSYITTNPYLAQAYARLVLGALRDQLKVLDRSQPVYIVELGGGSGRFAFHFLKKFIPLLNASPARDIPFRYVLTDYAAENVSFWRGHPAFEPFTRAGQLDFACFDAVNDESLALELSGARLEPGSIVNPLILVGNYFFDSIPQDVFFFKHGTMQAGLVSLDSPQEEADPTDPDLLPRLKITFSARACPAEYYADPDLDAILAAYRQNLRDAVIFFPSQAIRCLRAISRWSSGRALLVTGDMGDKTLEALEGTAVPDIRIHGSFSMWVNFHALGQYAQARGGLFLHSAHRAAHLEVCAFWLGEPGTRLDETRLAYQEAVERAGPDDFFTFKQGVEKAYELQDLPGLLAFLRLSGWDARVFLDMFPTLVELAPGASEVWQAEVCDAAEQVDANSFHLGEERDLPFNLGVLLFRLGRAQVAARFFEQSLAEYGPAAPTFFNLAACLYRLNRNADALARARQALALEPAFEPAAALAREIERRQVR